MTDPTKSHLHVRKALALAVLSALCAAQAAVAAPSATAVANSTPLGSRDAVTGALPEQQPLHVVVALKLRNKDALDAFVAAAQASQATGATFKPMASAQVLADHMPTREQAQAVADYLSGMGFRNVRISANRLLVKADGTAAIAARAFQTSFRQVRMHDGRLAFANVDDAHVPAALADKVQSVLGLQDVYQAHTFATTPRPLHTTRPVAASGSAHPMTVTNSYLPEDFAEIYGASVPPNNVVKAGIVTEGDVTQSLSDLNHYVQARDFTVTTHVVAIDGATSGDTSGTAQWSLASQVLVGASRTAAREIYFYNMTDTTNGSLVDAFNQVVSDNHAQIVSVSMGECETAAKGAGGADAADAIFEVGVAQGQTFAVATGDSGADECPADGLPTRIPSWPANSQYVVAVAGNHLDAGSPSSSKHWVSETVWSGTGGSQSQYEPRPAWQTLGTGRHRLVADVAFDADPNTGASIYLGNGSAGAGNYVMGGTNLAASIFAGLWTSVLKFKNVGFAGPILYAMQPTDFHDITAGSNGIAAAAGYDQASGRGSLILGQAIFDIDTNHLGNHPPVASFTFSTIGDTGTFASHSTDPDGDALTYFWDFGDDNSENRANPPHFFYRGAGTYTVTLTVTDTSGATGSVSHHVTVAPVQVIVNPHFDWAVHGPWVMSPGVLQSDAAHAHTGSGYALLGGGSGASANYARQTVVIPAGVTKDTLEYWLKTTADPSDAALDKLEVRVYSGGSLIGTPQVVTNLDATSGYLLQRVDMTPWMGKAVTVEFYATNNRTLHTSWSIDDVTVHGF